MTKKHKKKKKNQKGAHKEQNSTSSSSKKHPKREKGFPPLIQKKQESHQNSQNAASIQFTKKIRLDDSPEVSYRTFFHNRYGKHITKGKKVFSVVLKVIGLIFIAIFFLLVTLFVIFGRDLPDVSKLKSMEFSETTTIYDREGNILYSIYGGENGENGKENRKYVPLNYISPDAIRATLAIEDKNFYHHLGFDLLGIIRAQLKNIEQEEIKQGASTITQQLAKNIFLSSERTYDRKIKELLLSLQIEWMFSKDEILEMYLNKIAYGSLSFGIETASQTFFEKSSHDLTLVESAVLAALPKAPSYFSPYGENRKELMGYCKSNEQAPPPNIENTEIFVADETMPEDSSLGETEEMATREIVEPVPAIVCTSPYDQNYVWGRKDFVLERMVEDGYITKDQMVAAWEDGLKLTFADPIHKIEAPHFVFYVKELLEQKYGKELVENGGLEVKTTLDPRMQSIAEEGVLQQAEINLQRYSANNAGLVAIDVKTGQVLAMVGSVDYWNRAIDGQVNVTTSPRQPGSSFKPLVYALAMQNTGIGSGTILGDYRTVFNKKDVPRNADGTYKGRMTIRTALALSRNIPAIKAYYLAGEEEKLLEFFDKIGLKNLREFKDSFNKEAEKRGWTFHYGWPMALGSGEVKLLDLVSAYSIFPNQGKYTEINPIMEVRDRDGNILEKFEPQEGAQVIDPQVAFIINSILSDIYARPAGSWRANMTIPGHTVAAKTGTSNKKIGRGIYPNNNLIVGYTPGIAVGVWVGNTDGKHMRGNAWAFSDAAPIWKHFFTEILKDKPDENFVEPSGLQWIGREIYPGFAQLKTNFDSRFRKMDKNNTEDKQPGTVTDTLAAGSPSSGTSTMNTEAPPKVEPVSQGF